MEYRPRRKLTREFKLEAVRQMALSEKPKAQLARELDVRVGQLRAWRLEFGFLIGFCWTKALAFHTEAGL